jgi:hypothetical protein
MITYQCVQCGFCCRVSACGYGKWNAEKHQCDFLADDSTCKRYDYIKKREEAVLLPMMGCGCSSPMFNEDRNAKIEQLKKSGVVIEDSVDDELTFMDESLLKQLFNA